MSDTHFDYVIIGAGSAGSLLANRLSAKPGRRVLLLEAGGSDDYHWIHIPVGYLYCIGNPRTDWLYQTEAEPGLNGRRLRYPRGKVLGGCSSINGMIYMRGQRRDYDGWAETTGESAWRWDDCLPFFKRHEDHWRLDEQGDARGDAAFEAVHGHGGEWRVEAQRLRWDILDAFAAAAQQAGLPATRDFNAGNNEGVGYFEVNQRKGLRWNTARAFLRPTCYGRPNFEMWTGVEVERLCFDSGADGRQVCTGALVRTPHGVEQVHAHAEVLLCAGAIGSPRLLQLSGIGPGEVLQQAGIASRLALDGVGRNLQDHLQIRAVYKVQGTRTLNTRSASLWGKLGIAAEYALRRTGPMSMAPSQLGAFARSEPGLPWPDLEYHVQPLSLDAFGEPLHRFDAFTASVCNLNPQSRGTVHIRSPRLEDAPAIAPNYLSTERDRAVAARSLRLTRHIVSQPAMQPYRPEEWKPGMHHQSDEDLVHLAGDIATTIFHPVGTCRMGRADDPQAVLDPQMRLHGTQGLRVVDASAMPAITSGNTAAPVLMMAERAADWILSGA